MALAEGRDRRSSRSLDDMPAVARAAQRSLTATRVAQRSLNWKRRNSQELTDASMRRLSDALSIDLAEHLRLPGAAL